MQNETVPPALSATLGPAMCSRPRHFADRSASPNAQLGRQNGNGVEVVLMSTQRPFSGPHTSPASASAHDLVQMPCAGPAPPNVVPSGAAQVSPPPQSA